MTCICGYREGAGVKSGLAVSCRSLSASAALAAALAVFWLPGEARAACAPMSPVNNADVTCTGTTADQNSPNGYGTNTDTGNTVAVVPGATVTGTNAGIIFDSGTVLNSGSITGTGAGAAGIAAGTSATFWHKTDMLRCLL